MIQVLSYLCGVCVYATCVHCPVLSRVHITSCCLVRFSGLIHLSLLCLISLNVLYLSLIRCYSFRHKLVMVILASLLMSSLEKIYKVSMAYCWLLVSYFADVLRFRYPLFQHGRVFMLE